MPVNSNGANAIDYSTMSPFASNEDDYIDKIANNCQLAVGQSIIDRRLVTSTTVVGGSTSLRLAYFYSRKTETISQVRMLTGATGAGATPTLCRMGLYEVAANGDLTLVASAPNDTSLWTGISTFHTKSFSAPYQIIQGKRYAFAFLIVTAATAPNFTGSVHVAGISGIAPRLTGLVSAQNDLPATILDSSVGNSGYYPYAELLP